MSYILEALADSEQARQQIAAAPKYSLLPVVGEELPQQRRWPYVLAAALLVNAAVLQVWLRPSLPGGAASIRLPTAQQALVPAAAPDSVIAPSPRSEKPAADVAALTLREVGPPQIRPERADERRIVRAADAAGVVPNTASENSARGGTLIHIPRLPPKVVLGKRDGGAAVAAAVNPSPASTVPPSPVAAIPTPAASQLSPASPAPAAAGSTAEMPPALQQELPALSVAGFIRDDNSSSMVIVNDKLAREGDDVAPGVKLERILNDGLIFSYKGYRFKR